MALRAGNTRQSAIAIWGGEGLGGGVWLGFGRVGLAGDLAQVGQATGFGKAWAAEFAWI